MVIFFDTEFTGLVPKTTLISIGMVAANGKMFYGEFTDFGRWMVDDWQKENIFQHTIMRYDEATGWRFDAVNFDKIWASMGMHINPDAYRFRDSYAATSKFNGSVICFGDSGYIRETLREWLERFATVQFVGDVCHYDMTLLCNLFGGAGDLPEHVVPICYDICQDICVRKEAVPDEAEYWYADMDGMWNAFDISREKLLECWNIPTPAGEKHNALYDAKVIKAIYDHMRRDGAAMLRKDKRDV